MAKRSETMRRLWVAVALAAAAGVLAWGASRLPLLQSLELKTYDLRMRNVVDRSTTRDDIVVVEIDQESLRLMDPVVGRWPWPRLVHGQLVDFLAQASTRTVLYDVLFTECD